jgi:large subunit ribosomal protein L10
LAKTKRPPQTRKKLGGPKVDGHRADKVADVKDLGERFEGSTAVLVSEYRGMTVHELKELRTNLRDAGADYKVYKNTLATIAAKKAGLDELIPHLNGPTAFTFATGDPVLAAKRLTEFAKKVPTLVLKGGVLDKKVLSTADVTALGNLESREVMLAKTAGMLLSPIQKAANLFAAPFNQLGGLLVQLRDKLPAEAAPAAPEAPAEEAPAAEAPAAPEASADEAPAAEAPAEDAPAPDSDTTGTTTTETTEG